MIKNDNEYSIFRLSNGLRLVCRQREGMVSYIGMVINAGSRDESPEHEGLAHFVEHTIFKGTRKRRAWQVSSRMESVGGELNAYTSKEETMVYTNAPAGYEERAMELLADILTSSQFPASDIEKEREVIVEEIYSYLDSPSDRVYDEFEELAYKGTGLSHNILGTPESVRKLKRGNCLDFIQRFYIPSDMVIYCLTPHPVEKMAKMAQKYFSVLMPRPDFHRRKSPGPMEPFDISRDHGTHQANTIMGSRLFGRNDSRRFAMFLLNNYLAGPCMNSLLNQELREKKGYVYTVDSAVSLLSDTGLLLIYFGCDPANVEKCKKITRKTIMRLSENRLSDWKFDRIKKQYCGQLLASSDQIENRAMSMGKSVLYFDKVIDISATAKRIMDVTADEFRDAAELATSLSTLTLT